MISFNISKFRLVKRYLRFSNFDVYFYQHKKIRFGYKFYQKIFRRYRSKKTLKINVRKPRIAIKRKTSFGRALEIKNKLSYLLGGVHASKLSRFVRLSYSKTFSCTAKLADSLESRLDVILAKTTLFPVSWMIKRAVKAGFVKVDKKQRNHSHFRIKLNSKVCIRIPPYLAALFKSVFKRKLKINLVFWSFLPGFEFSRKTLTLIKYAKVPAKRSIYPFNFELNYFYRLYPR